MSHFQTIRSIGRFLRSPQAVEGVFSSVGYRKGRMKDGKVFFVYGNWGWIERIEMVLTITKSGSGLFRLFIPPICPDYMTETDALLAELAGAWCGYVEEGEWIVLECTKPQIAEELPVIWADLTKEPILSLVPYLMSLTAHGSEED